MKASGKMTRCKVMANFITRVELLHIKDYGLRAVLTEMATFSMTSQSTSTNNSTIEISQTSRISG